MSNTLRVLDNLRYSTQNWYRLKIVFPKISHFPVQRMYIRTCVHQTFSFLSSLRHFDSKIYEKSFIIQQNLVPRKNLLSWQKKRTGRAFQSNPPRKKKKLGNFPARDDCNYSKEAWYRVRTQAIGR